MENSNYEDVNLQLNLRPLFFLHIKNMMTKLYLTFVFTFCLLGNIKAQTFNSINGNSQTGLRADSIAKKILDTAKYKVGYV